MENPSESPRIIRFGVFEADLNSGELRKNGAKIKLQEQPFQLLTLLLARPSEVITREQLREKLWPADTFVDFDRSLNTAVSRIREALGDSAENPRFIETLPRRGYRFVAPVQSEHDSSTDKKVGQVAAQGADSPASRSRIGWYVTGAAGAVVAAVLALVWPGLSISTGPEEPAAPMRVVPLTSYPGTERHPSLSPDGESVAFTWDGEAQDNFDIYVQPIGSHAPPRRLTSHPDHDVNPAWSPDGRFIAFARYSYSLRSSYFGAPSECDVFVTPVIGGPVSKVAQTSHPSIAWLPDGRGIIGSLRQPPEGPLALFVFPTDGGETQQLTWPPAGAWGDVTYALSPDGQSVAFRRQLGVNSTLLLTLDLRNDFTPESPTAQWDSSGAAWDATWSPNGRDLIVVYRTGSDTQELRLLSSDERGNPRPLGVAATAVMDLDVSAQTSRLVFSQHAWDTDLAILRRNDAGGGSWQTTPVASSTLPEDSPHYSPDGKRIVFVSGRSGVESIWISDVDGSGATLLHTFGSVTAGSPRWSPDGQRIAFDSPAAGTHDIYAINVAGGEPWQLTDDSGFDHVPRWSADGEWIYFTSNRSGRWEIWKISAAGGEPQQVTSRGGTLAFASPDGEFLYYLKGDNLPFFQHSPLWRMPVGGGEESQVLGRVFSRNFAVTEDGIYFMQGPQEGQAGERSTPTGGARFTLKYLELAGGEIRTLATLPAEAKPFYGFAVSPAERAFVYSHQRATGADLMLVENFR